MESKRIKLSHAVDIPIPPPAVPAPMPAPARAPPSSNAFLREDEPDVDLALVRRCGVVSTPLPFQRASIHCMLRMKNVALFDGMGLGKTFQVLCAIRTHPPSHAFVADAVKAGRYRGNTLIVCPKIVQAQWIEQYERHLSPRHPTAHRALMYTAKTAAKLSPLDLCAYEIIVVTYDFLRSISTKNSALISLQYWRVVLDEVHCVKNYASKRFEVIDTLECTRRIALSGTPLHNTLTDVFPILRFFRMFKGTLPGAFAEWRTRVLIPLEANRVAEAYTVVQTLLQPCIIRRLKTSVWRGQPLLQGLPAKTYTTIEVPMTTSEDGAYNAIEKGCVKRGVLLDASTLAPGESGYEGFRKLSKLRLCCVDAALSARRGVREDVVCAACEDAPALRTLACACTVCALCTPVEGRCRACDAPFAVLNEHKTESPTPVEPHVMPSSKLKALEAYIRNAPRNDKIIVFSSWVMVLDSIQASCDLGVTARLDGRMNQTQRAGQLDKFRNTHRVLLMTFGAGSTGIDLTCANHVIFVDPHWSPAIEMQAEDRAYRIGQTKPVHIIHLIQKRRDGKGTIEHVVRGVQRRKRTAMHALFETHC